MEGVEVVFEGERALPVPEPGRLLLDLSREGGIAHVCACGGRARCSTCRVLVLEGGENLSPRSPAEAALARHKGLEDDVRLACQARVLGSARVRRLVRDALDAQAASLASSGSSGRESRVAVLFCDIRDFTPFAERSLPYDVVHVLNRWFHVAGEAVERNGGRIDNYMGDGIMALFGADADDPAAASRDAVRAAVEMLAGREELDAYLRENFGEGLEIGVGVHVGLAVVGNLGHPRSMRLSAIGDTVNVASRIEAATKEHGARLLVSDAVLAHVADLVRPGRCLSAHLKGRSEPVVVHEILGFAGEPGGPPLQPTEG